MGQPAPEVSLLPISGLADLIRPFVVSRQQAFFRRSTTKIFVDSYENFRSIADRMMTTPRPTDAELGILRVLWERGPSTVRQVHEALSRERPTAYTTAIKLMQIMTEKGLLRRDETDRTHIYHPRLTEEQTQRQLIHDLLDRAFGGSSSKLVMQALATTRASAEDLAEIRRLLDGRKDRTRADAKHEDTAHDRD